MYPLINIIARYFFSFCIYDNKNTVTVNKDNLVKSSKKITFMKYSPNTCEMIKCENYYGWREYTSIYIYIERDTHTLRGVFNSFIFVGNFVLN